MTSILKDHVALETKVSDITGGSGRLTGDQSDLMEGISTYLHGVGYPAMKDDILKQAQNNGASPSVLNAIKKVPGRHYASPDELLKKFSELG